MKNLLMLVLSILIIEKVQSQYNPNVVLSACPDNKSVVIVNYNKGELNHLNIKSETGTTNRIGSISNGTYANISVLNDSLVLLSGQFVYNYINGKRVSEFTKETFTTPSGKRIFQIDYGVVKEIDYTGKETGISFSYSEEKKIGSRIKNLTKINENADALVAAYQNSGEQSVVVFDLKTGESINAFDGYKFLNPKKEIHFLDLSPDGSQLIIGNTKLVTLYNVKKGKKTGEFEEIEDNARMNFMQSGFRTDGKAAYVSSWYKLYTLNTKDFTAEENIVIDLKDVKVFQWKNRDGSISKEKTYVNTKFFWSYYTVMKDEKYIVALADEVSGSSTILYYMYLGEGGIGNKNIQIF